MTDPISGKGKKQTLLGAVLTVIILVIVGVFRMSDGGNNEGASQSQQFDYNQEAIQNQQDIYNQEVAQEQKNVFNQETGESAAEDLMGDAAGISWAEDTEKILYSFRNADLLDQHYEKHGVEMGFATVEDYVAAANAVIQHPDVLHKLEAEDNDDIYFLEATSEFVVVSTDGYIRTYFIADGGIDYYNRQ